MMDKERRRHKRFSATAFLNLPIVLTPLPPYFGHKVRGALIDLSAGGMAILMNETIPVGVRLGVHITFPDQTHLYAVCEIRRVMPRGRHHLIGLEFFMLPQDMVQRIEKMSGDYIDCETRIHEQHADACRSDCAFFAMCSKQEKVTPVIDLDVAIGIVFHQLSASVADSASSRPHIDAPPES